MADPLTDKDLEQIEANLVQLGVAEDAIKRAEQAGLDVSTLKATSREQRQQLLKIKQTFFPGR